MVRILVEHFDFQLVMLTRAYACGSKMMMSRAESSSKLPANPVNFVGSEEVVGSDLVIPSSSLARSSLENAALDTAHMPISRVPNLIAGGHHTANLRGPVQPSSSMAQSLSHLDSNPQASDQKDLANFASGGESAAGRNRACKDDRRNCPRRLTIRPCYGGDDDRRTENPGSAGDRRMAMVGKESEGRPRFSRMDGLDQRMESDSPYSSINPAKSNGHH
ncbi:hypothetical protein NL676_038408 [Syzygium grande]|nr:hypothetical protein NL676_038408 [Syzygium grande]